MVHIEITGRIIITEVVERFPTSTEKVYGVPISNQLVSGGRWRMQL